MPPNHEIVEISLTCEGNFLDPTLKQKLYDIKDKLQHILHTGRHQHFELKKIEPWNSVKVTFDIPKEAADRLKLLAIQGNKRLKELGILSVEIGHSSAISLKQNDNTTNTNSIDSQRKFSPTSKNIVGLLCDNLHHSLSTPSATSSTTELPYLGVSNDTISTGRRKGTDQQPTQRRRTRDPSTTTKRRKRTKASDSNAQQITTASDSKLSTKAMVQASTSDTAIYNNNNNNTLLSDTCNQSSSSTNIDQYINSNNKSGTVSYPTNSGAIHGQHQHTQRTTTNDIKTVCPQQNSALSPTFTRPLSTAGTNQKFQYIHKRTNSLSPTQHQTTSDDLSVSGRPMQIGSTPSYHSPHPQQQQQQFHHPLHPHLQQHNMLPSHTQQNQQKTMPMPTYNSSHPNNQNATGVYVRNNSQPSQTSPCSMRQNNVTTNMGSYMNNAELARKQNLSRSTSANYTNNNDMNCNNDLLNNDVWLSYPDQQQHPIYKTKLNGMHMSPPSSTMSMNTPPSLDYIRTLLPNNNALVDPQQGGNLLLASPLGQTKYSGVSSLFCKHQQNSSYGMMLPSPNTRPVCSVPSSNFNPNNPSSMLMLNTTNTGRTSANSVVGVFDGSSNQTTGFS